MGLNEEEQEKNNPNNVKKNNELGESTKQQASTKKIPATYEEALKLYNSGDKYDNTKYTGPGFAAFENMAPMNNPNDFSEDFEKDFIDYYETERELAEKKIGQKIITIGEFRRAIR